MHMTLKTNCTVRIVDFLVASNQKADARSIFEGTCVPPQFTLKILRKLASNGIVQSYKRAHGGYTLARPDSRITLREVTGSVEGPYIIGRCQQNGYACMRQACRHHRIYAEISESMCGQLDSYTFSQVESCGATCHSVRKQEKRKVKGCPGVGKQLP